MLDSVVLVYSSLSSHSGLGNSFVETKFLEISTS